MLQIFQFPVSLFTSTRIAFHIIFNYENTLLQFIFYACAVLLLNRMNDQVVKKI